MFSLSLSIHSTRMGWFTFFLERNQFSIVMVKEYNRPLNNNFKVHWLARFLCHTKLHDLHIFFGFAVVPFFLLCHHFSPKHCTRCLCTCCQIPSHWTNAMILNYFWMEILYTHEIRYTFSWYHFNGSIKKKNTCQTIFDPIIINRSCSSSFFFFFFK